MWIERITARAFGGLHDQGLDLGPGLNVIYGPNEAGKSTWHAAIRMALTGVRRGRGSATKEAAALEERHRPWDDPDRWAVETRIHLADRRIDLVQDLLGKVACRATDLDLGVDVSAEITRPDGTPDATIWLGLDRDAFASTLAVGQGEMLAVADDAGELQEHMQRAAAAHGTDATAAGAIERLREHRRTAVGADTAVAKGPLRTAMRELAGREEELAEARRRHATFLEQTAAADAAAHALEGAERQLSAARRSAARAAAVGMRARADRAVSLAERHPSPPPELAARDRLADRVAAAVAALGGLPAEPPPTGRPSGEIQADLEALPEMPAGDLRPADDVVAAVRELELATEAERALVTASQDQVPAATTRSRPVFTLVAAAGLATAAVVGFIAGIPILGIALAASSAALAGWWALARRRSAGAVSGSADPVAAARERVAAAHRGLEGALQQRGIAPGPDPLVAAAAYVTACRDRAEAATAASAGPALRRELDATRESERLAALRAAARRDAERSLRAAAAEAGIDHAPDAPLAALITALEGSRAQRAAQAEAAERAIREYEELAGLLGAGTVADLVADADRLETVAASLEAAAGSDGSPADEAPDEAAATAEVERRRQEAAALAGALAVREADLVDVAAAEEAEIAARLRLERVRELAGLIDETMALLEAAQRQVHRDLAPLLAAAIRQWLPVLSGGAYTEAGVNPADLSIEVKEAATGAWRQARLLSGGTREQIYLLLRVAMAQHLVTTAESAPILLDEVTAQADAERRDAILDMLLTMAADRQLILFSHDEAVVAWAEGHLVGEPHRIIRLPLAAPQAAPPPREPIPVGSAP